MVADRAAVSEGLASAVNPTDPFPLPGLPVVIVIHVAAVVAVQPHPVAAVTAIVPVSPLAATDWLVGAIVGAQAAPACVTENELPAMVSEPLRDVVVGVAATLNETVPAPDPV